MTGSDPRWSEEEIATLVKMIRRGDPMSAIGRHLGRSIGAVRYQCRRSHVGRPIAPRLISPVNAPEEPHIRAPAKEYPPDCCTWMEGHRPNWTRCEEKVFRKSAWCEKHYRRVYSYQKEYEYVRA
jgi:hypothetical protein